MHWKRGFKAVPNLHAKSPDENFNCLNQIQSNSGKKKIGHGEPQRSFFRWPSGAHKSVLKMHSQLQPGALGRRFEASFLPKCEE